MALVKEYMRIIVAFCFLLSACSDEAKLDLTDKESYERSLLILASEVNEEDKPIFKYVIDKYKPSFPMSEAEIIRASTIHNKYGSDIVDLGNEQLDLFRVQKIKKLEEDVKHYSKILVKRIEVLKSLEKVSIDKDEIEVLKKIGECSYGCNDIEVNVSIKNKSDSYVDFSSFIFIYEGKIGLLSSKSELPPKQKKLISFKVKEIVSLANRDEEIVRAFEYLNNFGLPVKKIENMNDKGLIFPISAAFIDAIAYEDIVKLKKIDKRRKEVWSQGIKDTIFSDSVWVGMNPKIDSIYNLNRTGVHIYSLACFLENSASLLEVLKTKNNSELAHLLTKKNSLLDFAR